MEKCLKYCCTLVRKDFNVPILFWSQLLKFNHQHHNYNNYCHAPLFSLKNEASCVRYDKLGLRYCHVQPVCQKTSQHSSAPSHLGMFSMFAMCSKWFINLFTKYSKFTNCVRIQFFIGKKRFGEFCVWTVELKTFEAKFRGQNFWRLFYYRCLS